MKDDMNNLIERYFDGELLPNEEIIMFTRLSQDEPARNYFKHMNILKTSVGQTLEDFPENLENKILTQIAKMDTKKKRTGAFAVKIVRYIPYAAAAVLIYFMLMFYNDSVSYRGKFNAALQHVTDQNKKIQLLYNSLPVVEVGTEFQNEIIVKANLR